MKLPLLTLGIVLAIGLAAGQQNTLIPGQSMNLTVSLLAPSPKLTAAQMATVHQSIIRKAISKECNPFPCRMGSFTTYICPAGYALLNQWQGVIASSIPDGDATMVDIWDEDKRTLPKCQSVADYSFLLALLSHKPTKSQTMPIPKELQK